MNFLTRLRRPGAPGRRRAAPARTVLSRFGAFGPGTGHVVAFVNLARQAPEHRWRAFASLMIRIASDDLEDLDPIIKRLEASGRTSIDPAFLLWARDWAYGELEEHLATAPDRWFKGTMTDGRPAVPSGVKWVCANRLGLAAEGLAAIHLDRHGDAAEVFSIASMLVPFEAVSDAAGTVTHPTLIEPFADHIARQLYGAGS